MSYRTNRSGQNVDELLDKIDDLENATTTKDGTMSHYDKSKLDELQSLTIEELNEILN